MHGWTSQPTHRAWLAGECDRLVDFAEGSVHPSGFGWLADDATLHSDKPVEAWVTCRMTHVFALAHLSGRPGAGPLVDHGVAALRGPFADAEHGGWYASVGEDGPVLADKRAYEHAFVILAASSATAAGRPGARELLADALDVSERRFWDEREALVVDVWDRSWTELEPYRGLNANMHTVEAYLAAADVTGEVVWLERALRICTRAVHEWAAGNAWRLPEHFDTQWRPLPDYNTGDRAHRFRPYGATVGHALEWSRLCLHVRAGLGDAAPAWLLDDAAALFAAAVRDGWAVDGADGFVYTTDWDGTPVVRDRLHWVVAEGIAAAAALGEVTGDAAYEHWYRTWWDYAATHLLDHAGGSWHHELDTGNHPSATVWQGKPDAYHAVQTTLVPRLPLAPTLATALGQGLLR